MVLRSTVCWRGSPPPAVVLDGLDDIVLEVDIEVIYVLEISLVDNCWLLPDEEELSVGLGVEGVVGEVVGGFGGCDVAVGS